MENKQMTKTHINNTSSMYRVSDIYATPGSLELF